MGHVHLPIPVGLASTKTGEVAAPLACARQVQVRSQRFPGKITRGQGNLLEALKLSQMQIRKAGGVHRIQEDDILRGEAHPAGRTERRK